MAVRGSKARNSSQEIHYPAENESVLVGIPAFNEEHSIGSLLWKLDQVEMDFDVLVLDDGSDTEDETVKIAKDHGAIVKRHKYNLGKGRAIQNIFKYTLEHDYDYLVLIDGDGQHDPYQIPGMVSNLVNPGADFVIGTRWGEWTEMPFYRKIGKNILDKLTPGGKGRDTQSGFRALNRKAVEAIDLTKDNFAVESEMLAEAHEKGLKIRNHRITCNYEDVKNASTHGPVKHGLQVMNNLIRMTVERRPMLYFGVAGFICFFAGLVMGAYVIHIASTQHVLSVGYGLLTLVFIIMGSIFITSGFILNEILRLMKKHNGIS